MTTQADLYGYANSLDTLAHRVDTRAGVVGKQRAAIRDTVDGFDGQWGGTLPGITTLHAASYVDATSRAPTALAAVATMLRSWATKARQLADDAPSAAEEPFTSPLVVAPAELTKSAWDALCNSAVSEITTALQAINQLAAIDYTRASDQPYDPRQLHRFRLAGLSLAALSDPDDPADFADTVWGALRSPYDLDLALLAKDVYDDGGWYDPDREIGNGWTRVPPWELPPGLDVGDFEGPAGFRAAVYTDGNGNYVLAFAGTHVTSPIDWATDVVQGSGLPAKQFEQAIALANAVHAAYGDDLAVTGHSLGGGLATAASAATGAPGVVFNAAGLNDHYRDELDTGPAELEQQIRHYHTDGDILTGLQESTPINDAMGTQYVIESGEHSLGHGMGDVVDGMQYHDIHLETGGPPPQPLDHEPLPYEGPSEPPAPSPGPAPEPYG